jgi:C4-dicarboxylate-specific signal transduction histidine kinase
MIPLETAKGERTELRSPLAQLLHALNQPLTGLQCSMEVALATPRTPEQYVHGLHEGLRLTERMRALVEAIREVADAEADGGPEQETTELKTKELKTTELKNLLRETVDDLEPVAEMKDVRLTLDVSSIVSSASPPLAVRVGRPRLAALLFRLLDSALSLAQRGTALRIETDSAPNQVRIRIRWHAEGLGASFSRPELGLVVARAGFERAGAEWERERSEGEDLEMVTIGLAGISISQRNQAGDSE